MAIGTLSRSAIAERLSSLRRAWALVGAACGRWTAAWLLFLVLQGALPAVTVYLTRLLVDRAAASLGAGASPDAMRHLAAIAVAMAAVLLAGELLRTVAGYVQATQSELLQEHVSELILAKSAEVDLAFYESPEYYDRLHRARSESANRLQSLLTNSGSALQSAVTLLAMAAVLLPYGVWLPPLLLLSATPAFYALMKSNARYHEWWRSTTSERRWQQYYDTMLTSNFSAPEVRTFGLGNYFRSAHRRLREHLRREHLRLVRVQNRYRLAATASGLLVVGVALAWMIARAMRGLATLGDLVLFYQVFSRGQALLRSLLESGGEVYNSTVYLASLFQFLAIEPEVVEPAVPATIADGERLGVHFRHVTFAYPHAAEPALRDLDLHIPGGQVAAIVGENGAGKTTLLKLLCRFYDPSEGAVEIGGVDVRDLSLDDLRRRITVLFQWPVTYQATARDNIALGDVSLAPDEERVEAAARAAGAHEFISRLPEGYETMLGKWLAEGCELSGGEWQRLALARAYMRQADIIVLDEPTSFMDSWSEADWFERCRALAAGRTAIVITHRFTIAMRADVIHVMQGGRVVESGSHDELLGAEGLYAQSWASQMRVSRTAV